MIRARRWVFNNRFYGALAEATWLKVGLLLMMKFILMMVVTPLLPGMFWASGVVAGTDDTFDKLDVEYEIIVQEDLDAIFAPGRSVNGVHYSTMGREDVKLSCVERARNCKYESYRWSGGDGSLVMSRLDKDSFFTINWYRGPRKLKMVKATTGYLYVIDYTYPKPEILFRLDETGF